MPATWTHGCRRNGAIKNERDDAYPAVGAANCLISVGYEQQYPWFLPAATLQTCPGTAAVKTDPVLEAQLSALWPFCRYELFNIKGEKKNPVLLTDCRTRLQEPLCPSRIRPCRFSKESGVEASFPHLLF